MTLLAAVCFGRVTAAPLSAGPMAPAQNSSGGVFVGIEGGPFKLQSLTATSGSFSADFTFKNGTAYDIPLGYDFGQGLSMFLTVGRYNSGFSSLIGRYNASSQAVQCKGDLSFLPVMANAAYKVKIVDRLNLYLGAGVGGVRRSANFLEFDYPSSRSILFGALGAGVHSFGGMSDTQWVMGYQAFAGLSFDITPHFSLHAGYRYFRINSTITVDGSSSGNFNGNAFEFGATAEF